jgi:hypothetical protein
MQKYNNFIYTLKTSIFLVVNNSYMLFLFIYILPHPFFHFRRTLSEILHIFSFLSSGFQDWQGYTYRSPTILCCSSSLSDIGDVEQALVGHIGIRSTISLSSFLLSIAIREIHKGGADFRIYFLFNFVVFF